MATDGCIVHGAGGEEDEAVYVLLWSQTIHDQRGDRVGDHRMFKHSVTGHPVIEIRTGASAYVDRSVTEGKDFDIYAHTSEQDGKYTCIYCYLRNGGRYKNAEIRVVAVDEAEP